MKKNSILNYELKELKEILAQSKEKDYRASQIFDWIYKKNIYKFSEMLNISSKLRDILAEKFSIKKVEKIKEVISKDGTAKILLGLGSHKIECVFIPDKKRYTGCISTQIGCPIKCKFCASSIDKFVRNLEVSEMIEEIIEISKFSPDKKLTNIVLMGIGEPLLNPDLYKFLRIITSDWGMGFSSRKVTVSTVGIVPKIYEFTDLGFKTNLAISLHATDDTTRQKLIPNVKYPVKEIIEAAKYYFNKTKRAVTFEYTMLQDVNDSLSNAKELVYLTKNIARKINLIPYNEIENIGFYTSKKNKILEFKNFIEKHNISVSIRKRRGDKIDAACGQLRLKN